MGGFAMNDEDQENSRAWRLRNPGQPGPDPADGTGGRQGGGAVVPWETPELEPRGEATRGAVSARRPHSGRDNGPSGKRPGVRVPRALLVLILSLFVIAILAIVALVLVRPQKTSLTASRSSVTPSPSAASPSPSAPSPSPSEVSPTAAASPATTGGTSPGVSASPGASSSTIAASGSGAGSIVANVSELTPVQKNVGSVSDGPEQIGTVTYQDSVDFSCENVSGQNVVYEVANYKFLTALIGLPSDSSNAIGNAMTITFFKDGSSQLGGPVTVTLDHPQSVHLNLQGASQLEIACSGTSVANDSLVSMDVVLGNATLGPN
jgi:hypothetical protein